MTILSVHSCKSITPVDVALRLEGNTMWIDINGACIAVDNVSIERFVKLQIAMALGPKKYRAAENSIVAA